MELILASQSKMRCHILECSNIVVTTVPANIDEESITKSLIFENVSFRDIPDTLAEYKAKKISAKNPEKWVLGCDQVLVFQSKIYGKPASKKDLLERLQLLQGRQHRLITANVIFKDAKPLWRHVAVTDLTMHSLDSTEIHDYVDSAWPSISDSCGGYYFEKTPHLFSTVRGNWFDILGLSIGPILSFLNQASEKTPLKVPPIVAVLGHPISHSKSPRIHRYWLNKNRLNGDYIAIDIPPKNFSNTVKMLASVGVSGFNVTVPYKESALALADTVSQKAGKIGSANTLTVTKNCHIYADNTDAYGFMENLRALSPNWDPKSGPALVLGAGGAARAVLFSLIEAGAPKIYLCNRTRARAEELMGLSSSLIDIIDWKDRELWLPEIHTLVNTTSLGMIGKPALDINISKLRKHALVTDLVYSPLETDLLRNASRNGCHVVGGVGMLLHQAVPGFEGWFGVRPNVDEEIERLVLE